MATDVGAVASAVFLTLTVSVYRFWRPRRLVPAHLRHDGPHRPRHVLAVADASMNSTLCVLSVFVTTRVSEVGPARGMDWGA